MIAFVLGAKPRPIPAQASGLGKRALLSLRAEGPIHFSVPLVPSPGGQILTPGGVGGDGFGGGQGGDGGVAGEAVHPCAIGEFNGAESERLLNLG